MLSLAQEEAACSPLPLFSWSRRPAAPLVEKNLLMFSTKELSPLCSSAFTSVDGRFHGGWQLDAVVDPLSVTNLSTLAALNSLLNQEAKDIAWILGAGAVPL